MKILVIDQSPFSRFYLEKSLEGDFSLECLSELNTIHLQEKIAKLKEEGHSFDLIFFSIYVEGNIVTLINQGIHSAFGNTPIIITYLEKDATIVPLKENANYDVALAIPFDKEQLSKIVKNTIQEVSTC